MDKRPSGPNVPPIIQPNPVIQPPTPPPDPTPFLNYIKNG